VTLEIELDRPGRHQGALLVPWSRDESAYGQLVVPVTVLNGGPGPTLLLTGGVHGDEYEGQIVLAELARTLDPADLYGRVILVPRANPPACRAGRRTSPVDDGNLARLFPGQDGGGLTSRLAAAIARELLPLADAVVDLHAGGTSLEYIPCAWGRLPARPDLAARVLDMMQAFGTPYAAMTLQAGAGGTLVARRSPPACPPLPPSWAEAAASRKPACPPRARAAATRWRIWACSTPPRPRPLR